MTDGPPRKTQRLHALIRRRANARHVLLFVIALLGLLLVSAAEFGPNGIAPAQTHAIRAMKGAIVAALKDPLSLLAERSPGSRGAGALHLTKSHIVPQERVLPEERIRPIAPNTERGPVVNIPLLPEPPLGETSPSSTAVGNPQGQGSGPSGPFNTPPLGFPGGFAGIPSGGAVSPGNPGGGATSPNNPNSGGTPLGNPGGTDLPPGNTTTPPGKTDIPPGGATPPGNTDTPPGGVTSPPGNINIPAGGDLPPNGSDTPPNGGGNPPIIPVPEPGTSAIMIFGLWAVAIITRRNKRQRARRF